MRCNRSRRRAHIRRILTSALALVGLATATTLLAGERTPPGRPNIVFIMADDLGYADLGCYGQSKIHTPRIDRLATEGMRFTHARAGASVCAPSRCVLLTGLHGGHARIRDNGPAVGGVKGESGSFGDGGRRVSLTESDQVFAENLQSVGYATGAMGKWGVGEAGTAGVPNRHGFSEWFGFLNQNHAPFYYTDFLWRNDQRQPIPENADGRRQVYAHDLLANEAVAFLRRHRSEPFFLYLPFTLPHRRFEAPSLGEYSRQDWPDEAKLFAAMVSRLDHDVGRVLDEIDSLGLADNTLVIFTSDNGTEQKKTFPNLFGSAGRFRGEKGTLYEGGIRVPMIVRWPGKTPKGAVSRASLWFPDVFPTLVTIGGGKLPAHGLDGLDVSPTLMGRAQPELEERMMYWEAPGREFSQAAVRGHWKVLRAGNLVAPLELFDLDSDVGEKNDVASGHPEVVARFERFLATARTPSPYWPDPK